MPVDSHLDWTEIRDFTPGLWTTDSVVMPSNAAQQMTDCYPLKEGGLRAWFKPSSFPVAGITNVNNETPEILFVHELHINRSGVGTGNDYYLVTYDRVSTVTRFYRMDQTAAGPPVTWTLLKTTAAGLEPNGSGACAYVVSSGDLYACFPLGAGAGTDNGLWIVKYSDGSQVHQHNHHNVHAKNYQSRLITTGSVSDGDPATIYFTDPALLTNMATNTAPVDISEGIPIISGLATFSPGDLLVFKAGAPIYLVEGDLNNYTVRQMNGSKVNGISQVRGPEGIIFLVVFDGVYMTPDGSQIMPMSKALAAGDPTAPLAFQNHWLMTGQGKILDTDTGAWFTTSFIPSGQINQVIPMNQSPSPGFLVATNSPLAMTQFVCQDGASTNRAESYTWKSATIRHPSGRQMRIRSVEVYAKSFNGATASITVTINGVPQTINCDSSGKGALTFYALQTREELDITVTAASNAAGVEAPMIDVIRIGSQAGHFLRQVADVG